MIRNLRHSLVTYEFAALQNIPSVNHSIFARHGGVSPQPWHSLNLSAATGDSLENIHENYRRLYAALGYTPTEAVTTRQVHGATVSLVNATHGGERIEDSDALITNTPNLVLLQRHADCLPLLLVDPKHRAIGVAHAGWRGTLANIAGAMVRAMQAAFDSQPAELIAGIGPGIGACCYHVGGEVQQLFQRQHAEGHQWLQARAQHVYLDLWAANRAMLQAIGVQQIEMANLCTACHVNDFYSARAEQRMNGCFGAAIVLTA